MLLWQSILCVSLVVAIVFKCVSSRRFLQSTMHIPDQGNTQWHQGWLMKHWTTYGTTCSKFGVKNFIPGYRSQCIVRFKMASSSFMLLAGCIDMVVTSHWIQGIILDSTYLLGISITKRTIHASSQLTVYYGVLLVWYIFLKAEKEAVNLANWGIHLPAFPERGLGETGEERAIAPLVKNVRSRQCCIARLLKKIYVVNHFLYIGLL